MKKVCLLLALVMVLVPATIWAQGNHFGEQKMLSADIQFINAFGTTITNAEGTFYHFYGAVVKEAKVYNPEYWGEFPLYFFNRETGVMVTVRNNGPREQAKVRVVTESYVLHTDGSHGVAMTPPRSYDIELARGETKTINASFTSYYTPEAESGLDCFIVKVLHVNQGGGPGNAEPGLIMSKVGVYCPPKYIPQK